MIDYLYDGTFEGFLTCVHHHYYTDKAAGIFVKDDYQASMLNGYIEVGTEEEKATTVYDAISRKISPYDLRRIYKVFLSNDPDKEMKLLRYIVMGFKVGSQISMMHSNPIVFDVQAIEKKIAVEKERMLQFVRFSVMEDGVLFAQVEPDHDILELLHVHFCDRFRNDPFIIHDKKRNKALVAYQKVWYITEFHDKDIPRVSDDEMNYRHLWKNYFDNIAIKQRTNPKCQRRFMPERYWKYLTEMTTI